MCTLTLNYSLYCRGLDLSNVSVRNTVSVSLLKILQNAHCNLQIAQKYAHIVRSCKKCVPSLLFCKKLKKLRQ